MIFKEFKIDIYHWTVVVIMADDTDKKAFRKIRKKVGISKKIWKDSLNTLMNNNNAGEHLYDLGKRHSVIIVMNPSSKAQLAMLLSHELRHCEDRILLHLAIKDVQAAAFLSGYIAEKVYPLIFKIK